MTGSQIRTELTRIIDSLIIDNNSQALDDDQPNLLQDGEERQRAIDQLVNIIGNYREIL